MAKFDNSNLLCPGSDLVPFRFVWPSLITLIYCALFYFILLKVTLYMKRNVFFFLGDTPWVRDWDFEFTTPEINLTRTV